MLLDKVDVAYQVPLMWNSKIFAILEYVEIALLIEAQHLYNSLRVNLLCFLQPSIANPIIYSNWWFRYTNILLYVLQITRPLIWKEFFAANLLLRYGGRQSLTDTTHSSFQGSNICHAIQWSWNCPASESVFVIQNIYPPSIWHHGRDRMNWT